MTWKLLTTPPSRSGRYVVGHRGYSKVIYWLNPKKDDPSHVKTGWQKNPRDFGATHYMPVPIITKIMCKDAEKDFKRRGMTRLDPRTPRQIITKPKAEMSSHWLSWLLTLGKGTV